MIGNWGKSQAGYIIGGTETRKKDWVVLLYIESGYGYLSRPKEALVEIVGLKCNPGKLKKAVAREIF
jgi:hypothetical protein